MKHNHDYDCNGFPTPIQDVPICDPCCTPQPCAGTGMGRAGQGPDRNGMDCNCNSPVPPPIPPVRYIPGMNVQEQMCNMAERVNCAINRWNQIQANCYEALDNVVGAAVNNDVYYAPDEVRYTTGYSETDNCAYALVEARACDRAGKPIFVHLRAAYNNETNSGARENIADVSFVTSAQMVLTAVQATESHWDGTSFFNGNPGAGQPNDTIWVAGWNRNGTLRFFPGDVSSDTLRQNRMVNCIGPVFPILQDGKLFNEVLGSMGEAKGSIQAMGWKKFNGNKVFFSCSLQDEPGMSPVTVAKLLQGMGVTNAVITSYQTSAVNAWDTEPVSGTDMIAEGTPENPVISAPGFTGGMTFLGKLTTAPIQWNMPANVASWVVSKRPPRGWCNQFTTQIANTVQKLGNIENTVDSLQGQMDGDNQAISKLQYQVEKNTGDIANLSQTVEGFDDRITQIENATSNIEREVAEIKTTLETEITTREQQYTELKNGLQQETAERKAEDNALDAAIKAEESARKSADNVLQSNINAEATTRRAEDERLEGLIDAEVAARAAADRNLQTAIENEVSARRTKDTEHETKMEEIEAKHELDMSKINKFITDLQDDVDNIENGSGLPIATDTTLGAIKVGRNLTITADGTLSAVGGGSGDSIVAGNGIKTSRNTSTGEVTVSVDPNVVPTTDEIDVIDNRVTALETKQADQATKDQKQDEDIAKLKGDVSTNSSNITNITNKVTNIEETTIPGITQNITNLETSINEIKDGTALPIATATTLGAIKIGANLSISEDGTLSASAGEAGGENVAQGTGITVEHNEETNIATVSINADTMAKINAVDSKADKTTLDNLITTVAGKANKTDVTNLETRVTANEGSINSINDSIATIEDDIDSLQIDTNKLKEDMTNVSATATVAKNTADTAKTAAENAQTAANNAQTTADEAQTAADAAQTTANEAKTAAENAQSTADSKVSKTGDTMTGELTTPGVVIKNGTNSFKIIGNVTGGLRVGKTAGSALVDTVVTGVARPAKSTDAANKAYVDDTISPLQTQVNGLTEQITGLPESLKTDFLPLEGGTMRGAVNMGGNKVANIAAPTETTDATNKDYVDSSIRTAIFSSWKKTYN